MPLKIKETSVSPENTDLWISSCQSWIFPVDTGIRLSIWYFFSREWETKLCPVKSDIFQCFSSCISISFGYSLPCMGGSISSNILQVFGVQSLQWKWQISHSLTVLCSWHSPFQKGEIIQVGFIPSREPWKVENFLYPVAERDIRGTPSMRIPHTIHCWLKDGGGI